jgi:hypothetical protein
MPTTDQLVAVAIVLLGLGASFIAWGIIKLHNGE